MRFLNQLYFRSFLVISVFLHSTMGMIWTIKKKKKGRERTRERKERKQSVIIQE